MLCLFLSVVVFDRLAPLFGDNHYSLVYSAILCIVFAIPVMHRFIAAKSKHIVSPIAVNDRVCLGS